MTDVARLIADMVREGVDPEMIGRVAQAMADLSASSSADVQADRRRAKDAARKAAKRAAEAECLRTSADSAESADPLPKVSEVPHTPPNLPNPSPPKTPLKGVKKVPATVPDNWEVSEEGLTYATERGMDLNTVVEQQNRFKDHSRSKGTKYLDFEAAWRTWVRNWQDYRSRPPPSQSYRPQSGFRG